MDMAGMTRSDSVVASVEQPYDLPTIVDNDRAGIAMVREERTTFTVRTRVVDHDDLVLLLVGDVVLCRSFGVDDFSHRASRLTPDLGYGVGSILWQIGRAHTLNSFDGIRTVNRKSQNRILKPRAAVGMAPARIARLNLGGGAIVIVGAATAAIGVRVCEIAIAF